jgi:hypothetical protein
MKENSQNYIFNLIKIFLNKQKEEKFKYMILLRVNIFLVLI